MTQRGTPRSSLLEDGHGRDTLRHVDAHHARVTAAGVRAVAPQDMSWGARSYSLLDPEGYGWSFARKLPQGYQQTQPLEEGGLREVASGARNRK